MVLTSDVSVYFPAPYLDQAAVDARWFYSWVVFIVGSLVVSSAVVFFIFLADKRLDKEMVVACSGFSVAFVSILAFCCFAFYAAYSPRVYAPAAVVEEALGQAGIEQLVSNNVKTPLRVDACKPGQVGVFFKEAASGSWLAGVADFSVVDGMCHLSVSPLANAASSESLPR